MTQRNDGGPQWTDATTYSHGQRGNIDPTSWEIRIHGVRVYVTRKHIYNPENWSLICHEVGADVKTICPSDAHHKDAQNVALKYVATLLRQKSDRLRLASDAVIAARDKP